jgi:hypothetical protein
MRRALVVLAIVVGIAGRARAGDGAGLVKYMPSDIDLYMAIDVAGARGTPLFKDAMAAFAKAAPDKAAVMLAAGIDADTIDTLVAGDHVDDPKTFVAVVEGKAVDLMAAKMPKSKAYKPATYHGVTYWAAPTVAVAIVDHRLIYCRPELIEHALDVALGRQTSAAKAATAQPLRDAVAATDTRHDVWIAIVPPAKLVAKMHAKGVDVTSISIAASVSDVLAVEVVVQTPDEDAARKAFADPTGVVSALEHLGLTDAAKSYDARLDGPTVHLAVTFTEAELGKLAGAVATRRHHHP